MLIYDGIRNFPVKECRSRGEARRGEAESLERTINEKEVKCSNVKCSVLVFVFVNGDELSSS